MHGSHGEFIRFIIYVHLSPAYLAVCHCMHVEVLTYVWKERDNFHNFLGTSSANTLLAVGGN